MQVAIEGHSIDLGPSPSKLCQRRWLGQLSPEPETVAWIKSLPSEGVFFDIGANVGTFSVRAALKGLRVVAFEPTAQHYWEFSQIIERNALPILLFPLALSNSPAVGVMGRGRSSHTLLPLEEGKQGVIAWTIDAFITLSKIHPNFVKIDVDGDEPKVLRGMIGALISSIQSLLVEVDPGVPGNADIPSYLQKAGFDFDQAQVDSCMIKGGKYDGCANYIFNRRKKE